MIFEVGKGCYKTRNVEEAKIYCKRQNLDKIKIFDFDEEKNSYFEKASLVLNKTNGNFKYILNK